MFLSVFTTTLGSTKTYNLCEVAKANIDIMVVNFKMKKV